jgi:hypothetical protein
MNPQAESCRNFEFHRSFKKAAFLVLMVLLLAGADAFAKTQNWTVRRCLLED